MKELKYNINYLLRKKELYIMIIFLLIIVIANVYMVSSEALFRMDDYKETIETAEYLQIFSGYSNWILCPMFILGVPILSSLVFCDISWTERKGKIDNLLSNRLDYKTNTIVRFFLTIFGTFLLVFLTLLLDYLCLVYLFGSGAKIDYSGGAAFNIFTTIKFLKELFYVSPFLHSVVSILHISLIFGLLTGLSYALSFYLKQKVLIYFTSPIIFLVLEVLLGSSIVLRNFSILLQVELRIGNIWASLGIYAMLFISSILLIGLHINKKDVLL